MMQRTEWKNPYIERVVQVESWIPVNSSSQPDTASCERVKQLLSSHESAYCELGSGSGMHLLGQARLNPDSIFFGIELRYKRAFRTIEKARKEGLENVYVLRTHANFLPLFFPHCSLSGIFMNFPDPWERKKWNKHRMFSRAFLERASALLKPEGFVSFKTDHAEYFSVAEQLVAVSEDFEIREYTTDLVSSTYEKSNVSSEFEQLFRSKALPVHYLLAKKI